LSWSNIGSSAAAGAGIAGARRAGARRAAGRALRAVFFLAARAGFFRAADVFEAFGLAFDRRAAAFLARFFAIRNSLTVVPAYSSPCSHVKGKR
jgi:hypothetical protein